MTFALVRRLIEVRVAGRRVHPRVMGNLFKYGPERHDVDF